jgi:hypothetical protein
MKKNKKGRKRSLRDSKTGKWEDRKMGMGNWENQKTRGWEMGGDGRRETGDGRQESGDRRWETGDGRRETGLAWVYPRVTLFPITYILPFEGKCTTSKFYMYPSLLW